MYYWERGQTELTAAGSLFGCNTTLTLIIDKMDQAKFCIPRHVPNSKALSDMARPRLHTIGVRAAGFGNFGYIVDPSIAADSNLWIEIILLVLSSIHQICITKKIRFPERIVVFGDNASDNKNGHTFTFVALMTSMRPGFNNDMATVSPKAMSPLATVSHSPLATVSHSPLATVSHSPLATALHKNSSPLATVWHKEISPGKWKHLPTVMATRCVH